MAASREAIQKMTGYPLSAAGVAKKKKKDSCPYLQHREYVSKTHTQTHTPTHSVTIHNCITTNASQT